MTKLAGYWFFGGAAVFLNISVLRFPPIACIGGLVASSLVIEYLTRRGQPMTLRRWICRWLHGYKYRMHPVMGRSLCRKCLINWPVEWEITEADKA